MGRIVVTEFVSLDGVMEDPGGAEDFKYGGWSFEFSRGDEGDKFKLDEAMESDALLLGRRTYEGFAEAWPEREGEFADRFNSMPKYVVSSTLADPEWTNSTVLDGADLSAAVAQVKDAHDGDVVVHGSASLVQGLLEAGLVDERRSPAGRDPQGRDRDQSARHRLDPRPARLPAPSALLEHDAPGP